MEVTISRKHSLQDLIPLSDFIENIENDKSIGYLDKYWLIVDFNKVLRTPINRTTIDLVDGLRYSDFEGQLAYETNGVIIYIKENGSNTFSDLTGYGAKINITKYKFYKQKQIR